MMNFDGYTPEMLVYFHAMPQPLQNEVQAALLPPQSMEALAAMAEQYAQVGFAGAQNEAMAEDIL